MKRLFAVILLLSLLLSGCSVPERAVGDTVDFTDALSRSISVEKHPPRVAALLGSFADVWLLAGGELCAASSDANEDFGIDMSGMVNLGGAHSPSLELLLSAAPDLVLASASTASNVKMKDTLEAAGITVAYFDVDSFDDYLKMLDICTSITGNRELYEVNGLAIKREIDEIKTKTKLSDENKSVLLLRTTSTFVKAKGSEGTILGEMLSDLGCINIADSDSSLLENLSIESIMRADPYRIFVVTMGNDLDGAIAYLENMIKSDPAWSTLSAVRDGRLHFMDKSLFNLKPNDRWAEAYETLSSVLCETK